MATSDFTIERDNDVALAFTGTLLADVSSRHEAQERWTEIRLFRTEAGNYVCHVVGASSVRGESNRSNAYVTKSGTEVRDSLRRVNHQGVKYLTHLALTALKTAGSSDEGIAFALTEQVA